MHGRPPRSCLACYPRIPYDSCLLLGEASAHTWVLCPQCYLTCAFNKTSINVCNMVQLSYNTLMSTNNDTICITPDCCHTQFNSAFLYINHFFVNSSSFISTHTASAVNSQISTSSHVYSVCIQYYTCTKQSSPLHSAIYIFSRYDNHHSPR